MERPAKARVTKRRTVHTYAELWHASACVLRAGELQQPGYGWQFLSSIVLTAFAFEAYLNHVGPTVLRSWVKLERLPPLAKLDLVCEVLNVELPGDKGQQPQQTVFELLNFRNTLAHGRTQIIEATPESVDVEKADERLGKRVRPHWETLIQTSQFAKRAREDVESILRLMHEARPKPKDELFTFGISAGGADVEQA